ncbi:hypothetical protein Vafri_21178 [Volvox africanus]|uniref:Uncharacterized protein n=1 Tax=Volvox africanus TaxID=51714 RepID=A0A8J4BTS7_9CHLO|nr:hypothetical protein Vafri_21178 [Volvox africanus]
MKGGGDAAELLAGRTTVVAAAEGPVAATVVAVGTKGWPAAPVAALKGTGRRRDAVGTVVVAATTAVAGGAGAAVAVVAAEVPPDGGDIGLEIIKRGAAALAAAVAAGTAAVAAEGRVTCVEGPRAGPRMDVASSAGSGSGIARPCWAIAGMRVAAASVAPLTPETPSSG